MTPSLSEMVTDGANRVGPRGEATPLGAIGFVAAVGITVLVLRKRRSGVVLGAAAVAVLASAVPGVSIAERRADAPGTAPVTATLIERFQGDLESFAEAHGCAAVVRSACTACDPIVDFALATTPRCAAPAPVVLGADALSGGCRVVGGTLVCGTGALP